MSKMNVPQALISPTRALPLPFKANHHTDVNITTLILDIQSLCHARDHSALSPPPSPFVISSSSDADAAALQTLIRQKLHRLQDQILKRAMRKLEELLDYDLLPGQQPLETDDDAENDDDGVLLPVPLKLGSRRVRARAVAIENNKETEIEDADMDPLERLERKVLEVQIYQC